MFIYVHYHLKTGTKKTTVSFCLNSGKKRFTAYLCCNTTSYWTSKDIQSCTIFTYKEDFYVIKTLTEIYQRFPHLKQI